VRARTGAAGAADERGQRTHRPQTTRVVLLNDSFTNSLLGLSLVRVGH